MNTRQLSRQFFLLLSMVFMAVSFMGCQGGFFSSSPDEGSHETAGPKSKKTTAVYLDFEDVLIPLELSVVKNRTVIISTPGFTSGMLTLKGRVERRSIFNFFSSNMQKDNWQVVSHIKSPGTTIMVFQKSSRTAVITIRDEQVYTYVEVGISPTMGGQDVGISESSLIQ